MCHQGSPEIAEIALLGSSSQTPLQSIVPLQPIERELSVSDAASGLLPPTQTSPDNQDLQMSAQTAITMPQQSSNAMCIDIESLTLDRPEVKSPVPKLGSLPLPPPQQSAPSLAIIPQSTSLPVVSDATPTPPPSSKISTPLLASSSTSSVSSASLKAKKRRLAISADLIAADKALAKKKRKVDDTVRTPTPDTPGLLVPAPAAPRSVLETLNLEIDADGDLPKSVAVMSSVQDQLVSSNGDQQTVEVSGTLRPGLAGEASKATEVDLHSIAAIEASPTGLHALSSLNPTALPPEDQIISQEIAISEAASKADETPNPEIVSPPMADGMVSGDTNQVTSAIHNILSGEDMDLDISDEVTGQGLLSLPNDISSQNESPPADSAGNMNAPNGMSYDDTKEITAALVPQVAVNTSGPIDVNTTSASTDVTSSSAIVDSGALEARAIATDALQLQNDPEIVQTLAENLEIRNDPATSSVLLLPSRDKAADFWVFQSSASSDTNDNAMDISTSASPKATPAITFVDSAETSAENINPQLESSRPDSVMEEDVMDFLGTITLGSPPSPTAQEANVAPHQLPTPPTTGDPTPVDLSTIQSRTDLMHKDRLKVIAAQRGSTSTTTFAFNFALDSAQRVSLHLWQHRKTLLE